MATGRGGFDECRDVGKMIDNVASQMVVVLWRFDNRLRRSYSSAVLLMESSAVATMP